MSRSTNGGGGCNNFVPVLAGDDTKIAPTGDIFDQPPSGMISIRGKVADHVGDHNIVLSSEGAVLVTSPGTESSYHIPALPNTSSLEIYKLYQVLYFPPTKRFDGSPPNWGMLRRSRCVQFFYVVASELFAVLNF